MAAESKGRNGNADADQSATRRLTVWLASAAAGTLAVFIGVYLVLIAPIDASSRVHVDSSRWQGHIELLDGTDVHFGKVKRGADLSRSFRLRNGGRKPLPTDLFRMGCSCNASMQWDKEICQPGEIATMRFTLRSAGNGPQLKEVPIVIHGVRGRLFTFRLAFDTHWLEKAEFTPNIVDIGPVPLGAEPFSKVVELVLLGAPDDKLPEVLSLTSTANDVTVEPVSERPNEPSAGEFSMMPLNRIVVRCRLAFDPSMRKKGLVSEIVKADTTVGVAKLRLRGYICDPVIAFPSTLLVSANRKETQQAKVRIQAARDIDAAKVVVVSSSSRYDGVQCRVGELQNEVCVTVDPHAKLEGAEIVVTTSFSGQPFTITVPIASW